MHYFGVLWLSTTGVNVLTVNGKTFGNISTLSSPFFDSYLDIRVPPFFISQHHEQTQRQPPTELMMAEFLIPLPLDGTYWRNNLSSLDEEITMPAEKFDEVWPLVKEVYSRDALIYARSK